MQPKEVLDRYEKAKTEHEKFKTLYDEVYKYLMPDRYSTVKQIDMKANKNRIELYSSVPEQGADKFVQRIQSLITPVNSDWISFEAGYALEQQGNKEAINQELEKISKMLNVYKDVSNFDAVMTEFFYDLVAGTSFLLCLEGTANNPFIFKAIPFKDMAIAEGVDGSIQYFFRSISMKYENVKKQWKDAKFDIPTGKELDTIDLVEATYFDDKKKYWIYNVIVKSEVKTIVERNYKTSPFICLRWTKSSGETYGRGCGLKALADCKTLNRIVEYGLRNLAFTVPVFTASMDGGGYDIDEFVFEPGAINPVPSNMSTNPTIQQLQVAQQADLMQFNVAQLEMNIKKAMYDTTIPNDPTKMTATEINERVGELAQSLNNNFGRLVSEFLYPLVKRMVEIVQNLGIISQEINVNDFNGFGYKIRINTPLVNQQKLQKMNQWIQFLSMAGQFDPGFNYISKVIKFDEVIIKMAQMSGIDASDIRTAEEIEALKQQEAQAMANQQQQAMNDQVAMSNAIEQGKADAQASIKR